MMCQYSWNVERKVIMSCDVSLFREYFNKLRAGAKVCVWKGTVQTSDVEKPHTQEHEKACVQLKSNFLSLLQLYVYNNSLWIYVDDNGTPDFQQKFLLDSSFWFCEIRFSCLD